MSAVVGTIVGVGSSIFGAVDRSNLQHQMENFKEKVAAQAEKFKEQLGATAQAQSSSNASQQTLQDLYGTSNKNNSSTYLIAAGLVIVGGAALLLILNKKTD